MEVPEDEKEDAAVTQNIMTAQVHHQEEVETEEGEGEEAEGEDDDGEDVGDEGDDDGDDDDDDDEIDDLVASGHIKMKVTSSG